MVEGGEVSDLRHCPLQGAARSTESGTFWLLFRPECTCLLVDSFSNRMKAVCVVGPWKYKNRPYGFSWFRLSSGFFAIIRG